MDVAKLYQSGKIWQPELPSAGGGEGGGVDISIGTLLNMSKTWWKMTYQKDDTSDMNWITKKSLSTTKTNLQNKKNCFWNQNRSTWFPYQVFLFVVPELACQRMYTAEHHNSVSYFNSPAPLEIVVAIFSGIGENMKIRNRVSDVKKTLLPLNPLLPLQNQTVDFTTVFLILSY